MLRSIGVENCIFSLAKLVGFFDANISHFFSRILTLFPTLQRAWLAGGVCLFFGVQFFQTQHEDFGMPGF